MNEPVECSTRQAAPAMCGSEHTPDSAIEVLRNGGSPYPLFIVHDIDGQTAYGAALGQHIDLDVPIYGIPGAPPQAQLPSTIEGLASRCIRLMRAVQPRGPYRIAGWSFGGILAYEIAMQLIGQDQAVEFLGLIDSTCPVTQRGTRTMTAIPSTDQQQQRCCVENPVRLAAHQHAQQHYAVQRLPILVHVFSPTAQSESCTELPDPMSGWDAVLPRDRVRLHRLPVSRESLLSPPRIAVLAGALSAAIRTASNSSAPREELLDSGYYPHLCIQTGRRGRVPIFCAPGAGNSVTGFNAWASAVGEEWPVHGLQPRGLADHFVPHSTVQAAAARYMRAIDDAHPHGPLHLLGHSFGGWIVLELAHRLRARGRTIASVTVIDAEAPGNEDLLCRDYTAIDVLLELVDTIEMAVGQPLGLKASDLMPLDDHTRLQMLHRALVRAGVMPMRSSPEVLSGTVRVFGAALRTTYQPSAPYPDPLRLVTVSDARVDASADERRREKQLQGWRCWAPQLHVWHGPGNHMTLLDPPYVLAVADWWRSSLQLRS